MKKIFLYGSLFLLIAGANSCSGTYHFTSKSATTRTRNVTQAPIVETTNVTDLEVDDKKVYGSYTETNITEDYAKNMAVYDALKKSNADVLVEPSYTIEISDNTTTANVQGFPGNYKNFRRPTTEDSLLLGWKKIVKPQPRPNPANNSSNNNNCCCCNGNNNRSTPSNTGAKPQSYNPSRSIPSNSSDITPVYSEGLRQQYQLDYNRYHTSGKRLVGAGLPMFLLGTIMAGCSVIAEDESVFIPLVTVGSIAAFTGLVMFPVGAGKLTHARHIKREAATKGINLALVPSFNLKANQYGVGMAMKF